MKIIKCPKCGSQARIPRGSSTTCLGYISGYYDEDGEYHENEDPNITTLYWLCTNCDHNYETTTGGLSYPKPIKKENEK